MQWTCPGWYNSVQRRNIACNLEIKIEKVTIRVTAVFPTDRVAEVASVIYSLVRDADLCQEHQPLSD